MGVFADALAAAMNPSCAGGNHAAIYVERQVLAWFRDLLGFPAESMGLLVSGGSMATMTALAVARHVKSGVDVRASGPARRAAAVCVLHVVGRRTAARGRRSSCSDSAARRSGRMPIDADFRMNVDALDTAIEDDRRAEAYSRSRSIATRRHDQHRRDRRHRPDRGRLPAARHLAARRRGLRRPGDPLDRLRSAAGAARARRQRRARSAQVDVRAGRSRPGDGPRRRGDAIGVQPGRRRTCGPTAAAAALAARRGSASTAFSRREASAR